MTGMAEPSALRRRTGVVATVLVLITLPLVLALAEAVGYHVRNRSNGTLVSSGEEREYLLYVPRSYDRSRPTPLVISLHGGAMWPAAQMETSQWNRVADAHGFIVVYPSALSGRGPRAWRAEGDSGTAQEVQFISALIDTLRASYNIDSTMIYANGLSNGGGMAFVLACTLSDRIAAVGVVGVAIFLPWSGCTDKRAVPLVAFHGVADKHARYHGGKMLIGRWVFPDIPEWTARWARRNRCSPTPSDSTVTTDVVRRAYTNCTDEAAVVLYTVEGGGHTWPGGGPMPEWFAGRTTHSIDASGVMWEFFRQYRLPPH